DIVPLTLPHCALATVVPSIGGVSPYVSVRARVVPAMTAVSKPKSKPPRAATTELRRRYRLSGDAGWSRAAVVLMRVSFRHESDPGKGGGRHRPRLQRFQLHIGRRAIGRVCETAPACAGKNGHAPIFGPGIHGGVHCDRAVVYIDLQTSLVDEEAHLVAFGIANVGACVSNSERPSLDADHCGRAS